MASPHTRSAKAQYGYAGDRLDAQRGYFAG